ncbi:ferrous iron transport protein A [bacterium]|nr:ferrous iron transport protein A [bacterium]
MPLKNAGSTLTELARIRPGEQVVIHQIEGGWHMRQRLNQMGMHVGDRIRVVQTGAFRGPMLVEVNGSRLALGCGMARKVKVFVENSEGPSVV